MFEQSILIGDRTNRPWSFLASASAELLAVTLAILLPLASSNHLPGFHWRSVMVGPPLARVDEKPVPVRSTNVTTVPVFSHRPFINNPIPATRDNRPYASALETIDPPGLEGFPTTDTISTGPILFDKPIVVPRPPIPSVAPPAATGPMRVTKGVQMAKLLKQVIPAYPPLAKNARISGVVHLVGIIAKDGTIRNLQLISGHPLLAQAAMQAVARWVYRPTLLSGEPVEVICPIDVNFTLSP